MAAVSDASPSKKPPRMPRQLTFSGDHAKLGRLHSSSGDLFHGLASPASTISSNAGLVELQKARAAAEEAELVSLRRRIGTWKPTPSELVDQQQGRTQHPCSPHGSPEGTYASPVTLEAEASDPVSIGFELRPLQTLVRPEQVTVDGCRTGEEKGGASETGQQASSTPDGTTHKVQSPSKTRTSQHRTSVGKVASGKWQRRARNRQGSSEEVLARERQRLEEMVASCGLELAPDPHAPNKEVIRAAPAPQKKRSPQQQSEATFRLCRGLSMRDIQARAEHLRPQSACGGSAARFLRAEKQRLAGQPPPEFDTTTGNRPLSASSSRSRTTSEKVPPAASRALNVHGLPVAETAAILRAALKGTAPVHLTQGPTSEPQGDQGLSEQEGTAPSAALQAAVLTAALRGEIPVRSISTMHTKAWADPDVKAPSSMKGDVKDISAQHRSEHIVVDRHLSNVCIGGLYVNGHFAGGGAFARPGRDFELEEPDQELAPRCEAEN